MPQHASVRLDELLKDLAARSHKGTLSAPLGYRLEKLARAAEVADPRLGTVRPAELVAALLHATALNGTVLAKLVGDYREAEVWETRASLGEKTGQTGTWKVPIRSRGQHS